MGNRLVLCSLLLLSLSACATLNLQTTQPIPLYLDEAEMKAEVLKHISIGMAADEAKRTMERYKFECSYDDVDRAGVGTLLVCSKVKPQECWWDNFFMSDIIRVLISVEAGVVKSVAVKTGCVAL
jgi:hypothetical protein